MLADLLWPDAPPERVRRNFSDTLYRLHHILGPGWFETDNTAVALAVDANLWVDLWEFERLVSSALPADLARAVELYVGDLLPEIYDEWIMGERELRRSQYLSALESLAAEAQARGELQAALLYARRLISADPLHEPAHQTYLRLLGRLQRYGEALAHYEHLTRLFRQELGVEPLAETRALAQALQSERHVAASPAPFQERTPFVGRAPERALALAAVQAALAGRGGVLALEAEAGMGKSRFVREIASSARWRGLTVLSGLAGETPAGSPFQPLADAFLPLLSGPAAQSWQALLPDGTMAALAPLDPAWIGTPGQELADDAADRFFSALYQFGEVLARRAPLMIAFDDLQWADPVVWKSLNALLPALTQNGALVLLAYRRRELEKTPGWETLRAWESAGWLQALSLPPLTVQEVAELIPPHSNADPRAVHALTGGNPYLLTDWLAEPGPSRSVGRTAIARRLNALAPDARSALSAAAVLGENIPFRLLLEASDLPSLKLASLADELTAGYWLQPSAEGYTFVHDLVRTAVYDEIEPSRRRDLHQRAARAYTALYPDNVRAQAFHLDRAEIVAQAAETYRLAGEQDRARFAFGEAQRAFERALTLFPASELRARIETGLALARVCAITGDHGRQYRAAEQALDAALQLEDEALLVRAHLALGRAAGWSGRVPRVHAARAHLREALALARATSDRFHEVAALFELGDLAAQQGEWKDVQQYHGEAQALIRALAAVPDFQSGPESQALAGMERRIQSTLALQMGSLPELARRWEQELANQQRTGNRVHELETRMHLLGAYYNLSAWTPLLTTASETLALADALGDRFKITTVQYIQGMAAYCLGDFPEARHLLALAQQGYAATEHHRSVGLALNMLALVAEAEGDYPRALDLLGAALSGAEARQTAHEAAYARHDLGALLASLDRVSEAIPLLDAAYRAWAEQGNPLLREKTQAVLGLALFAAGDRARARELAASGWAAFQEGVPLGESAQAWLWALSRLLTAVGRVEPAHDVLRAAYSELQRQARTIAAHELRESFFERVPLNRQIVAAYDELTSTPRGLSVRLARRAAPLGRALKPDEFVTVHWTVHAPADEAIRDKSTSRRFRLQRLLREAQAQDAAPTDDDLARALGVSRRTILRDMQALSQTSSKPPTRKRKRA